MITNFIEYVNYLKEELEKKGYKTQMQKIDKGNGITLEGIKIYSDTSNVSPVIYIEELYHKFLEDFPISNILKNIEEFFSEQANYSAYGKKIMALNAVKHQIFPCLVKKQGNSLLTDDTVVSEWNDLAIVFRIMLQDEMFGNGTILIQKPLLNVWQLKENELLDLAMENLKNSQMVFKSLDDILLSQGCFPNIDQLIKEYFFPIYVVTNLFYHFGAAMILDTEKLKLIAKRLKDDFYIIPSSVHEVLCVPIHDILDQKFLNQQLIEINRTKVLPEEILEWHIYCYHADTGKITFP